MANIKALAYGKEIKDELNGKLVPSVRVNFACKMKPEERKDWRDNGWERKDFEDGSRGYWAHKYTKALVDELEARRTAEAKATKAKANAKAKASSAKRVDRIAGAIAKLTPAERKALLKALG